MFSIYVCSKSDLRWSLLKDQLISKANCQAKDSSKKWTNEFVFTSMRRVFVRFLEESLASDKTFRDYLTFTGSWLDLEHRKYGPLDFTKTSKVIELGSLFGNGALSDTIWVSTLWCSTTTPTAMPNQLKKCVLQMNFFP